MKTQITNIKNESKAFAMDLKEIKMFIEEHYDCMPTNWITYMKEENP